MQYTKESLDQFYDKFKGRNLLFHIHGTITQDLVVDSKKKLSEAAITGTDESCRLKLVSIFVELAQNVLRYSAIQDEKKKSGSGLLCIEEKVDHFELYSGNLILKNQKKNIQTQCNEIAGLNPSEIKERYRIKRKGKPPSSSLGAGLGLMDIALKSSVPITAHFEAFDDEHYFFTLHSKISKTEKNTMNIKATDFTPNFIFDPAINNLTISGESYPENVIPVYQPVLKWLKEYDFESQSLTLTFDLIYFNTSSSKAILDILEILEDMICQKKADIKVIWRYKSSLEVMLENGEDFMNEVEIPFELEEYK